MKRLMFTICIASMMTCFGNPRHIPPKMHPRPMPPPPNHHFHHSLLPSFIGGVVGGIIVNTPRQFSPITSSPIIQQNPVIVVQPPPKVWFPAHYEDHIQPDGTIVKIWIPGYWK